MKRFAGDSFFSLSTSFYNKNWWKLVSFIVLNQRVIFTGVNSWQTLFQTVSLVGEGYSLIKAQICAAPSGRVFAPFWSENGYILCPFWSEIGYGFLGQLRECMNVIYSFNSK